MCYTVLGGRIMEKERKTSKSQIAATRRYDDKAYDRITWRVPKGKREEYNDLVKPDTLNGFITKAFNDRLNSVSGIVINDLDAYARSAHMTKDEYIKQAVLEKMKRQDEEFEENN